jgi:hypothetical protein
MTEPALPHPPLFRAALSEEPLSDALSEAPVLGDLPDREHDGEPDTGPDGEPDTEQNLVEAGFRFLGVDVHVFSQSVRQLQYWCAVFAAFRVAPRPEAIRIRVRRALGEPGPRPIIEAHGEVREWNGSEELLPPLGVPPFNRWLYLSGSVVGRAGHAVLILAGPETGKTSLVVAALARGAWLLADGLVPLDPADLLVHPFPKSLRLPRAALQLLAIEPSHPALSPFRTRAGEVQWRCEPRALLGRRAANVAADIAAVVLLDASERRGEPTLAPLAPQEAFVQLVRHLHQRPEGTAAATDALVRLARRAPAFELRAGSSPQATAAVLDRLLLA